VAGEGEPTEGPTDPGAETEIEVDDGGTTTTTTTTPPPTPLPDGALTPEEVASEVAAIDSLLAEADRALRDRGDLGEYQRLVAEATQRLADLQSRINTA